MWQCCCDVVMFVHLLTIDLVYGYLFLVHKGFVCLFVCFSCIWKDNSWELILILSFYLIGLGS